MKLPTPSDAGNLCEQCVALCCRYYAFEIDKPTCRRDFEDMRWFMLHEGTIIFVEEGRWYIQINRQCTALQPDNRCAIYDHRPSICRGYTTKACDRHADAYDYEFLFSEPQQIERYAKEYLARRRRRRRAAASSRVVRRAGPSRRVVRTKAGLPGRASRTGAARRPVPPLKLRKTA